MVHFIQLAKTLPVESAKPRAPKVESSGRVPPTDTAHNNTYKLILVKSFTSKKAVFLRTVRQFWWVKGQQQNQKALHSLQ